MKITFSPKFESSVDRIFWEQSLPYKIYNFFRRDIFRFFRNIWMFRKALWEYRWWDYRYTFNFMETSFEHMALKFEKDGMEIDETRLPKVQKMKRVVEILRNIDNHDFISMAEEEIGPLFIRDLEFEEDPDNPSCSRLVENETPEEKAHNKKVFDRSTELERLYWIELWTILSGEEIVSGERKNDGSDLRGWWD